MELEDWFKPKGYCHFDTKLCIEDFPEVSSFVRNPTKVAKYPFFPLISYDLTKYKIIENIWGNRELDDSGNRPISYAAHLDAHIYAYYSSLLSKQYEKSLQLNGISENVIAFRKLETEDGDGKSNIHLANDAFNTIKKFQDCNVIAMDISKFFDSLQPDVLKERLCRTLETPRLSGDWFAIYKQVTNQRIVPLEKLKQIFTKKKVFNKSKAPICTTEELRKIVRPFVEKKAIGIPQGLPISAVLANLYMIDFDIAITQFLAPLDGAYFRYCDDLIFIIPKNRATFKEIETVAQKHLDVIGLKANPDKTEKSVFWHDNGRLKCDRPIQYLGFHFDGARISIRPGSLSSFRRKVKFAVKKTRGIASHHNEVRIQKNQNELPVFKRKLLRRYTTIGKRNFITYGLRAADIMQSETIRLQVKKQNKWALNLIRELKSKGDKSSSTVQRETSQNVKKIQR